MAEKICAAAVDAATYAIDKLYSYRVPDELREQVQIGTRVLVPFGFGNKRAEAVVLAFREDAGEFKLKPIVEVLDETPILTAEQLRLAAWMRERLYCTYFDCVHAMLPAGLWFKRNETYTLAPDADLAALRERDGEAGQVLALFEQPGQTLSVSEIRDRLGKGAGQTLDALAGEGILIYHSNTAQKTGDKTEKMLRLDMEASEAMSHISRRSPARMDVVSLLSDGGAMSQKEIVYMTGVSDAALRDMTKKGILRAEYEEVLRAPDFSEVPRAAAPVLSAAQQQAYDGAHGRKRASCSASVRRDRQRQNAGVPAADRARARAGQKRHCARARNWTDTAASAAVCGSIWRRSRGSALGAVRR